MRLLEPVMKGFSGLWAFNRTLALCSGESFWVQEQEWGWEEQVAGLVLAELWGGGRMDSASRLGWCVERLGL